MAVCPAKTQITLGIRPAWSESSLCAQWVAKDPSFLHADSEDSDQTGRMPRLIRVFAGRTPILLVLSCRGSVYQYLRARGSWPRYRLQSLRWWRTVCFPTTVHTSCLPSITCCGTMRNTEISRKNNLRYEFKGLDYHIISSRSMLRWHIVRIANGKKKKKKKRKRISFVTPNPCCESMWNS